MRNILTIAGSDPSGGAGIQADLKTMCALGVYGMSVITAVTAQNTQAVYGVQEISADMVAGQIEAVFSDIGVDAVKVGMVSSADIIRAIKAGLTEFKAPNIVIDPVMVSKSGFALLREDAVAAVRELVGIADVATPNIPEAEILAGHQITTRAEIEDAARRIVELGSKSVLIKGGHRFGADAEDLLYCDGEFLRFPAKRIATKNTHGTGCTLSAAIASRLGLGDSVPQAVAVSKAYITQAILDSYDLGHGAGPVGHLAALYRQAGMEVAE
ncbi:MAG: bifunctional hydroxymethylpyrimidine kinase/phosphomethylpyrimidine kinase [Propionibacteriaceae bacterium]|jgi:hydroxymethylpyrimidine/phosphomethylpyrimidine kinase|nr:bifunctional hydroxymethylpyrimidine kinase/phosphomethylpyrimidine kinase [Propionibacteriaceae bacterium]